MKTFAVWQALRAIFLPVGFPESVSEDYMRYQVWDSLQALFSYGAGVISTSAVLRGFGVGDAEATAGAAAFQWVLRDGAGMVGRIMFAFVAGSEMGARPKFWRLVADVLNDVAMAVELLSTMLPREGYFFALACAATVMRAVVGVAGPATRASFIQHQARCGNVADVTAKDASQETLVSLAGLVVGVCLSHVLDDEHIGRAATLFIMAVLLHLACNYMAVRACVFETLNADRFLVLLEYWRSGKSLPSPRRVAERYEPSIRGRARNLVLGASGADLCRCPSTSWPSVKASLRTKGFAVLFEDSSRLLHITRPESPRRVLVFLQPDDSHRSASAAIYEAFGGHTKSREEFDKYATAAGWNVQDYSALALSEPRILLNP